MPYAYILNFFLMNKLQASMYGAAAIVLGMQQAYAQG